MSVRIIFRLVPFVCLPDESPAPGLNDDDASPFAVAADHPVFTPPSRN
jgi:hypothetical protein